MSHTLPFNWVGIIPTVFGVIASSIDSLEIKLSSPISTGTGIPPANLIAEVRDSVPQTNKEKEILQI